MNNQKVCLYGKLLFARDFNGLHLFQILFCSTNQRTPHIIQKHQADNNHQCTDHRKATSLLQYTTTHISFSSLFYASQR